MELFKSCCAQVAWVNPEFVKQHELLSWEIHDEPGKSKSERSGRSFDRNLNGLADPSVCAA
ncbi:MAG: hypothetical protein CMM01_15660 [Rhodopirellula sp.]|nr:hypothetical protein [Rhodopirellula sp.]